MGGTPVPSAFGGATGQAKERDFLAKQLELVIVGHIIGELPKQFYDHCYIRCANHVDGKV